MLYLKYFESVEESELLFTKIDYDEYREFVEFKDRIRIEEKRDKILEIIDGRYLVQYNSYKGKDSAIVFTLPNKGSICNRSLVIYYYSDDWYIVIINEYSFRRDYQSIYKCDEMEGLKQLFNKIL